MSRRWRRAPPMSRRRLYHSTPTVEAHHQGPSQDPDHLGRLLDACQSPNRIAGLKKIHSYLTTRGSLLEPSLGIKLARSYASCGDPVSARKVFDGMPQRKAMLYNVMIRSYANCGFCKDAILMFRRMVHEGMGPDNYTFPCVLNACSDAGDLVVGMQIHGCAIKHGLELNVFAGNALISVYARCGDASVARSVFEGMAHRDVVSWNAIIAAYARKGEVESALEMCKRMVEVDKVTLDDGTMASILPALVDAEPGSLMFIRGIFDEMPRKGLVSWNAMIAMYVRNGMAAEAVEIFSKMELERIEPDEITLASILPACGDLSALSLGERIHRFIRCKGMNGNLLLENALIDMYAKCGCLEHAREVFCTMHKRDVVSWTSLISAYGMSGCGQVAMDLFEQMQVSGLHPDRIAFVSVLSACSHSGLLEEGRQYFRCMTDVYYIVPTIEHFACMVDLLGRSGNIEEAYAFIKSMPVEPNVRVWGALLNACRVYSNVTIGLIAADQLLKVAPEQTGYYVLLSNIYAKAGRWQDVASLRNNMKSKGLKKLPGCSNVELGNEVHTFLAGDRSHPHWKEIYEELEALIMQMKEAGYKTEVDSSLHDVEEEDKEGHLAVHSEKLALVFALMKTSPGTTIRITKNLRICGDCHTAIKFISKISERVIVVRDTNRFHHFKNGVCSCGDYW